MLSIALFKTASERASRPFPIIAAYTQLVGLLLLDAGVINLFWPHAPISVKTVSIVALTQAVLTLFFVSETWNRFAGMGPWNILPTVMIWMTGLLVAVPLVVIYAVIVPFTLASPKIRFWVGEKVAALCQLILCVPVDVFAPVPDDGKPRIICAKHRYFHDTVLAFPALNPAVVPISAEKMFRIPPFCFFLYRWGIMVKRDRNKRVERRSGAKAVIASVRKLKEGKSILMYPEGTRSETLADFMPGAFVTAFMTNAVVTPLIVRWRNPYISYWNGIPLFCPQPVSVYAGPDLTTEGYDEKQLTQSTWLYMKVHGE